MRNNRNINQLRDIEIIPNFSYNPEGSCLIKCGDTHVICSASLDRNLPRWLKNSETGWVTAEYGMLPRSTSERMSREAAKGKQSGRTQEIQRLIGRSLRSIVNLEDLRELQIIIDCDVIQADGGTRTASISGSFIALQLCINTMIGKKIIKSRRVVIIGAGIVAINLAKILEIKLPVKISVLKKQYKKMVKKFHPDVSKNNNEEQIIKLNYAYSELLNFLKQ